MAFRLLSYMVQVWEAQVRAAKAAKRSLTLYPIVPIVFYTGKKKWAQLPTLQTLMDLPAELKAFVPTWDTLFLNLHETPPDTLTRLGDAAALALRALQACDEPKERLGETLREVAAQLEALPDSVRIQINKALYYLYLLIKHKRSDEEQEELFAILDDTIERRADNLREVEMTGAEALMYKGQRELLKEMLEERFGPLPEMSVRKLDKLTGTRLKSLARRLLTADSLDELGLVSARA